ncbi:hypothetical protein PENARI_c017G01372 [Penicillium arizonense]|uniref:J domain-containing protein n=1 Tax=Penicillium arizonense TaxID=1835702 RepID=A0A1F5LB21_PENAI|nr:hypothetical protein PENARI_c017G01372 [Penicillium arizonense]OGE50418.1 hypothetical protein PENARI_c017G01372 [Penicillium arizonense]
MPSPRVAAIFLSPLAKAPSSQTYTHTLSTQPLRPRPNQPQNHHQQTNRLSKPQIHNFTTSNPRQAREPNFYEILDVPITSTPAEIKKQFYALSLRHHPDRNRSDPDASQRFARISAAYSVLSNAQKRATYDRDHGLHAPPSYNPSSSSSPGHTHAHPMGSHSSYAGSRPASGLSKRRGAFHGPPPSFYDQGGYGATGRQGEGYSPGKAGSGAGAGAGGFASSAGFGDGSGTGAGRKDADPEDWVGFINRNPLHHFNARGHFRTQAAEDQRRRERRTRAGRAAAQKHAAESGARAGFGGGGDDTFARFLIVSGVLVVAGGISGLFKWPAATPTAADVVERGKVRRRKEALP